NEFLHAVTLVEDVHRTAGAVEERLARVDPHRLVDRAEQVRHLVRAVLRVLAAGRTRANRLTHLQPAARHHRAHHPRPVGPAPLACFYLRRAGAPPPPPPPPRLPPPGGGGGGHPVPGRRGPAPKPAVSPP